MKAIIYARVSTDDGSQDAGNQLILLRLRAQQENNEVIKEYVDHASGGRADRPEFLRMFQDLEKSKPRRGRIVLYFFALDRLSREGVLQTLQYLERLSELNVDWKSATETYLDSTGIFREAIIAILAALARQEKIRIVERTKAGLARAKVEGTRSGKPIGRPRSEIDVEVAGKLVERMSVRAAAKEMGVPVQTLRARLYGRTVKRSRQTLGEPVWGSLVEGQFVEGEGQTVVRYDLKTGIPWCLNHRVDLEECRARHGKDEYGEL